MSVIRIDSYWVELISKIKKCHHREIHLLSIHKNESQHNFLCSHRYEINQCVSFSYAKTCTYSIPKTLKTWYACDLIHEKSTLNTSYAHVQHETIEGFQCNISHFNKSVKIPEAYSCGKFSHGYLFPYVSSDHAISQETTLNVPTV